MKWVLTIKTANEFGQELTLFERYEGGWGPFIERVHEASENVITSRAQEFVEALDQDVYIYPLSEAKRVAADVAMQLIRASAFGDCNHLDMLH